jgi:hypothetical protein
MLVPRTTGASISNTATLLEKLRRDVIAKSRLITLYPYLLNLPEEHLAYFAFPDRMQNLFEPLDQGTFTGVSRLSQNAAFLVSHLLEFPKMFASAIVRRARSSEHNLIIHTSLPAIFGFFSSDGQLDNAFHFYQHVSDLAKPDLAVRIIEPFFNSPSTFRFLEFALDRFFRDFMLDYAVTPEHERTALVPLHGASLLQCFVQAVPLLPRQHLDLLKYLHSKPFPNQPLADLFLVRFLWPATTNWLRSLGGDEQMTFLDEVLVSIGEQKPLIKKLWQTIFHAVSVFEVPQLFQAFDHYHLLYYLCVNDVILIAKLLDGQRLLPKSITLAEFTGIDGTYRYNWFWCHVFPKDISPFSTHRGNLIFPEKMLSTQLPPESEFASLHMRDELQKLLRLASSFEYFLEQRRKFVSLRRWFDLINTRVNQVMVNELDYLTEHPRLPVSVEVRQVLTISQIEPELLTRHGGELAACADAWDVLVDDAQNGRQINKLFRQHARAKDLVWQGLRMIRSTSKARLTSKFRTLLAAFRSFKTIADQFKLGDEGLCQIISQLPGDVILVPYIVLGATVVKDGDFMPEGERLVWVKMESCVLLILTRSPALMGKMAAIRDQLSQQHSTDRRPKK